MSNKVDLSKLKAEDVYKETSMAIQVNQFNLANSIHSADYLGILNLTQIIQCQIQSMMTYALDGKKEIVKEQKEASKRTLETLFDMADKIVVDRKKENEKSTH